MFYSHFQNGVNLTPSGSGSERLRRMRHLAVLAHQVIALALFYSIFPFLLFWGRWDEYWRAKHLYPEKIQEGMENQASVKESTSYVTSSWELETIPCVGHRVRHRSSVFAYVFQGRVPWIHGLISSCGCIIKWVRTVVLVLEASWPKQKEMGKATKAEILKKKGSWQKMQSVLRKMVLWSLCSLTQFQWPSWEHELDLIGALRGQCFIH